MNKHGSLVRGVVALVVLGALAAFLIVSPVGAAGVVTKKQVKKIATKVFNSKIGGASVANSDQLDGQDSTAFLQSSKVMWATVNAAGTLVGDVGATSAGKLGTGNYEVIFGTNVSQCAYQATVSDSTVGAEIGAQPRTGNANGVFITSWSSAGAPADKPFHLLVVCA